MGRRCRMTIAAGLVAGAAGCGPSRADRAAVPADPLPVPTKTARQVPGKAAGGEHPTAVKRTGIDGR